MIACVTETHLEAPTLFNGEQIGEGFHHFPADLRKPDARGGGAGPTPRGRRRRHGGRLRRHPPVGRLRARRQGARGRVQ